MYLRLNLCRGIPWNESYVCTGDFRLFYFLNYISIYEFIKYIDI